jgi:hypothetical protein
MGIIKGLPREYPVITVGLSRMFFSIGSFRYHRSNGSAFGEFGWGRQLARKETILNKCGPEWLVGSKKGLFFFLTRQTASRGYI